MKVSTKIACILVIVISIGLILMALWRIPSGIPNDTTTPLYPKNCHPVDADDVIVDRDGGYSGGITFGPEQEGKKDESEIKCVNEKKYQEIRHSLGLH